jgi:hypothetical protein
MVQQLFCGAKEFGKRVMENIDHADVRISSEAPFLNLLQTQIRLEVAAKLRRDEQGVLTSEQSTNFKRVI